jgi:hypothetical protein
LPALLPGISLTCTPPQFPITSALEEINVGEATPSPRPNSEGAVTAVGACGLAFAPTVTTPYPPFLRSFAEPHSRPWPELTAPFAALSYKGVHYTLLVHWHLRCVYDTFLSPDRGHSSERSCPSCVPWLCSLMTSVNVTTVCIHSTALGMMRLQPKSGILQTPRVCVGAPLWSGGSSGASARLSQLRSRQWLVRLIIGTKTCTGHAPGVGSCPSMIQLRTALRTALDGSSIPHGHTFSLP